jgi:ornithine cyclodeaminase
MLIIRRDEVERLVTPDVAIRATRAAFVRLHEGAVEAPPEFAMSHPNGGDIHVKGAHLHGSTWMVVKLATAGFHRSGNHGCFLGINSDSGVIEVLVDDDGLLTELRTAAAVAVSVDLLAVRDARTLAIVGSGVQAQYQLDFVRTVRSFSDVCVTSRNTERAEAFAARNNIRSLAMIEGALDDADVVLIATNSTVPVMRSRAGLKPGAHVTSSGADMVGKVEIAPDLVGQFDLVAVDDLALARRVGLLQQTPMLDVTTIGALLTGATGRVDNQQITLAGLSGLGVQDASIFAALLDRFADSNERRVDAR